MWEPQRMENIPDTLGTWAECVGNSIVLDSYSQMDHIGPSYFVCLRVCLFIVYLCVHLNVGLHVSKEMMM